MRAINKKIMMVLDGKPIPEKKLMNAIILSAFIQDLRVEWNDPRLYYWINLDTPEIKGTINGRIFPLMDSVRVIVSHHPYNLPVPRTDELFAYYEYLTGMRTWIENPMYENLLRVQIRKESRAKKRA